MDLTEQQRAFLEANHGAAMITLRPDGAPTAVRIGVALVDGQLWSSGTQGTEQSELMLRQISARHAFG